MRIAKKAIILQILAALVFFQTAFAQDIHTEKLVLENGLTVLTAEMPSSSVVTVYGMVKAGSATEGEFMGSGLSHFLEHMLFKGTKKRNVGEIAAEIQSMGGSINAATSFDYTVYTLRVPYDRFDDALDVLSDMLMNTVFDQEEIDKERDVVYGEIRMHRDNPNSVHNWMSYRNVFFQHPYKVPVIGYEARLKEVKRQDFIDYYKKMYVPNNMIISVAGNIKSSDVQSKVEKAFEGFERGVEVIRNLPPEPRQTSERDVRKSFKTDVARLSIAYPSMSVFDPDVYALDVLSQILGSGKGSRLNDDLIKDKELVHKVSSYNYTPVDRGVFVVSTSSDYENVDEIIKVIDDHLNMLKNKKVSSGELNRVKQRLKSSYILGRQSASEVNHDMAIDEAFTGNHLFTQKYHEEINNVTADDVMRVARKYFIDTSRNIILLYPEGEEDVSRDQNTVTTESPVNMFKLSNGVKVLLKKDSTIPAISMKVLFRGGFTQDVESKKGMSRLLPLMMIKGTKKLNEKKINEIAESRGIQFGGFCNLYSSGFNFNFTSEHAETAIKLMSGILMEPSFPNDILEREKDRALAGIKQRNDVVWRKTGLELSQYLFEGHAWAWPKIGEADTVVNIDRGDLIELHSNLISAENILVTVVGDINESEYLKSLEKSLSKISSHKVDLKTYQLKDINKKVERIIYMDKEQGMSVIGFRGTTIYDEDKYAVNVLSKVLGSSFNGRIFSKVREELGQAYTLGGGYTGGIDVGKLSFYVLTTPENVDSVTEIMYSEFENLKSELLTDKELENMKQYINGNFKTSNETLSSQNSRLSFNELYGLGYDHHKDYEAKINAVTKQDIQRVAKKYLNPAKSVVVKLFPEAKTIEEEKN